MASPLVRVTIDSAGSRLQLTLERIDFPTNQRREVSAGAS